MISPFSVSRLSSPWLTIDAPAKLNLFLEVLGRRVDGFHELETVMAPLRLVDTVRLRNDSSTSEISLEIDGPENHQAIPTDDRNLVVRALHLLQAKTGAQAGAEVRLTKRIPSEAGLGGGSSDAAATLALGNAAWELGLSQAELLTLAAELGSDVPFFLPGGSAICRGRGEQLEPIQLPAGMACVIAKPPVGLSTPAVFAKLNLERGESITPQQTANDFVSNYTNGQLALRNALQAPAEQLTPWIGRLRELFSQLPMIAHQMTGSGSAYFGLCHNARQARRAATWLRQQVETPTGTSVNRERETEFGTTQASQQAVTEQRKIGWVTATSLG